MKANELRVGNWYYWEAEGKKYEFQVEAIDLIQNYENFQPIPISFDWLKDFGFKIKNPHVLRWDRDDFLPFTIVYDSIREKFEIGYVGGRVFMPINYVHQLQNWYFLRAEKELIVDKLTKNK